MTMVKVCGVTRREDALEAATCGANAIGFVFWPESPRFIDPFRAAAIIRELPAFVVPVGVFVDQPLEYVEGVVHLARLGAVQLHGTEPPDFCQRVRCAVVKAIGVGPQFQPASLASWPDRITILLDAEDRERHGGTGRSIDWQLAKEVASRRRTILSGGLRAGSVRQALETVRPFGVDVSSGVESKPGVKDPSLLRSFFEAVGGGRS